MTDDIFEFFNDDDLNIQEPPPSIKAEIQKEFGHKKLPALPTPYKFGPVIKRKPKKRKQKEQKEKEHIIKYIEKNVIEYVDRTPDEIYKIIHRVQSELMDQITENIKDCSPQDLEIYLSMKQGVRIFYNKLISEI